MVLDSSAIVAMHLKEPDMTGSFKPSMMRKLSWSEFLPCSKPR